MTIYDAKQKAVDALGAIDLSKLSIMDVHAYVETLRKLHEIREPDTAYLDTMKKMTEQIKPYEPPKPTTLGDLR